MEDERDAVPTRNDRPVGVARRTEAAQEVRAPQRYVVDREIARGGMGRVVEAVDTVLGRTVALKEALVDDDETLRRFSRETRITAKLEHPSIVPVYDAGTAPDGTKFYVMRKVSGKPLDQLVDATRTLNERLGLVPNVLAAAQAIAHAHQRSILHRDVKPQNILVGELGETIVIDWGLAKERHEQDHEDPRDRTASQSLTTRYGAIVGTPGFMPPEHVQGEPVDERGDVFALGATLYYVLSGKPPFGGRTGDDVLRATLERPAPPLHEVVPGIPPELATITAKALAVTIADRYRDAGALAQDLQRFLAGQLVASHDYTVLERVLRFVRRHRVAVAVVAIAVVLLGVGGYLAIDRIIEARDAAAVEAANAKRERADADTARSEASDRADELTLDKARLLLPTNPTGAVALLRRLASSPVYWREARDLAAAARAAGVAWQLPAPKATRVSVAGHVAVSSGDDGAIRRFDLRARTTDVLAKFDRPVHAMITPDGKRVLGYQGTTVIRIDLATRTRRDVTATTEVQRLTAVPGGLAWTDRERMYLLLDDSSTPVRLDYELEPRVLLGPWVSPDGNWLGVCSKRGLELLSTRALERRFHFPGAYCFPLAWTKDQHLIATLGEAQLELELGASPREVQRTNRTNEPATSSGSWPVLHRGELATWSNDSRRARGDVELARRPGAIDVRSKRGDATLLIPSRHQDAGASADSPFVVVLTGDQLWSWNLDDILGSTIPNAGGGATLGAGDQVITLTHWLDLRTGESEPLPALPNKLNLFPTGQRDAAVAVTKDYTGTWLVRRGKELVDLGGYSYSGFGLVDLDHLVYAQGTRVSEIDLRSRQRTILVERDAPVMWANASPAWVVAAFQDDRVWRLDRTTGRSAMHVMTKGFEIETSEGTVYAFDGARLRAWRTDGSVVELTMPQPIKDLDALDGDHVMVELADHPSVLAVVSAPARIVSIPIRDPSISLATAVRPVGRKDPRTDLQLIDPLTGIQWTVARGTQVWRPQVGERHVLATPGADPRGEPALWRLELPSTPAATAEWIDRLTNVPAAGIR
jgi:hypothetical protein